MCVSPARWLDFAVEAVGASKPKFLQAFKHNMVFFVTCRCLDTFILP